MERVLLHNGTTLLSNSNKIIQYAPSLINEGLEVYVKASDPNSYSGGGTTWYDLTNNHRNGKLINSPTYNSDYFYFNAPSQQHVELLNTSSLASEEFTVSAVVKFPPPSTAYYVMSKAYDGGYGSYWFNRGNFFVGTSDMYFGTTSFTPDPDVWYYYTGTYKNNVVSYYVNGNLIGTGATTGTIRTNNHNITLGTYAIEYPSFSEYCYIGEFMYNSVALNASQVQNNFNAIRTNYNF